jgi:hypothetical protein
VQTLAGLGVQQTEIASLLRCDAKTLRKYYRRELDTGATRANVAVARSLYTNAVKHNNTAAQIWWTRARMGWKSVADVNIGGTDRPVAIDYTWAPALTQPLPASSSPPTIETEAETEDAKAAGTIVTWDGEKAK